MATTQSVTTVNLIAGADLTDAYSEAVKINNQGRAVKTTGANDVAVGVVTAAASKSGVGNVVAVGLFGAGGILRVKAGGNISRGQFLAPSTTNGALIGNGSRQGNSVGIALDAASSGDFLRCLALVA